MNRINIHWYDYAVEGVVEGTDERVKRIDGYQYHFVTSEGRVLTALNGKGNRWNKNRNLDFDSLREKKGGVIKCGYVNVKLYEGDKGKNHSVHRLVAQAFIPNPNNLPVVNHLKFPSNRVEDLEWETQLGNILKGKLPAVTSKSHLVQDPQGNQFEVFNLTAFCRQQGLNTRMLYKKYGSKGYKKIG